MTEIMADIKIISIIISSSGRFDNNLFLPGLLPAEAASPEMRLRLPGNPPGSRFHHTPLACSQGANGTHPLRVGRGNLIAEAPTAQMHRRSSQHE